MSHPLVGDVRSTYVRIVVHHPQVTLPKLLNFTPGSASYIHLVHFVLRTKKTLFLNEYAYRLIQVKLSRCMKINTEGRYKYTYSPYSTLALKGVGGQRQVPAALFLVNRSVIHFI
jgi:hypothetical protein